MSNRFDYDVVVIGSGFGGSVAALRLTEKGYAVGVLEAGRRFADDELPTTNWQVRKFFWAPKLGCTGIQRIHALPDVLVLAGVGVGGGSLVYANTLYEPHIFDGSAISANIGVNPSLTITAQAERAAAFWPNKGGPDTRPVLGTGYQRIRPVEPLEPVVPAHAPAALRLN